LNIPIRVHAGRGEERAQTWRYLARESDP
jgi:hypothetical protein